MAKSVHSRLISSLFMLWLMLSVCPLAVLQVHDEQKTGPAERWYQEGKALEGKADYASALTKYEAAVQAAEEEGNKKVMTDALLGIGSIKKGQGDYRKAGEVFNQAKKIAEELHDKRVLAKAFIGIGNIQERGGQYAAAHESYEAALKIGREESDKAVRYSALNSIGILYDNQGYYPQAMEHYQQALKISEDLKDPRGTAQTLNNLGVVYANQGLYDQAIESYQKALQIREQLEAQPGIAQTLNNLGVVYGSQGSYNQARDHFLRALKMSKDLGDKPGVAGALSNIGKVFQHQGQYGSAMEYYQNALKVMEELEDKRKMAGALNNIGFVYLEQGLYDPAVAYFQKSLKMSEEQNDRRGAAWPLHNLGFVYMNQGSYSEAIAYYQKSLKIMEALGDRAGVAWAMKNIGVAYGQQGLYEQALESYQKALKIGQEINAKSISAYALTGIGHTYLKLQKYPQALEILQQALASGEELNEPGVLWRVRYSLAGVHKRLGDSARALEQYQLAIAEIEKVRSESSSDEGKVGYLADKTEIYENLIQLLYKMELENPAAGYGRRAFEYAERAKARSFLDLLAEAKVEVKQGIDPDLLGRKRALEAQLAFLKSRLQQATARPNRDESRVATWETERDSVFIEYQRLQSEIRRCNPQYAALHYPEPATIPQVQSLLDDQTAVLSYVVTETATWLLALTRQDYRFYALLTDRKELDRLIREPKPETGSRRQRRHWLSEAQLKEWGIRQVLRHPPADPSQPPTLRQPAYYQEHYLRTAHRLYERLLQPAERLVKDKKHLIIVPDGVLAYLPFEVLLTKPVKPARGATVDFSRLPYLIHEYSVQYVPSASVWASLKTRRPAKDPPAKELLAIGDPVYPEAAPAVVRKRPLGGYVVRSCEAAFQPLHYSRQEVQRLAKLFPVGTVQTYLGPAATKENIQREPLDQYRRIHFATHGCLNEEKPQFSALVLGHHSESEDGFLQVFEIFNLKLNADLVVLSACVTGLGKEIRGEGLIGLTRAFLYAGTPSVVASLWNVDDYSSVELMEQFYRGLKGKDKAEALRAAKRALIDQGIQGRRYYSHPYFWSAFVLVGERH